MTEQFDQRMMSRVLRLATCGRHASPNPMVGCVITSNGSIIGEGYHVRPGQAHAEAAALRAAEANTVGATAYVNLEPCSHFGRTPPCADALIAAGIRRVVVACVDPDPRVAGNGIRKLRENGVQVDIGLMSSQSEQLNAAYFKHRLTGLPWIVLKSATSADGKVATASGDSKWISSPISRLYSHRQLRNRCDAILCGIGTVLRDDPELTTRLPSGSGRNPWRLILDTHLRTPHTAKCVVQSAVDQRTILFCGRDANRLEFEASAPGCTVVGIDCDLNGHVDIAGVIRHIGTRGDIISVLVEGGPTISASLLDAGMIDRWINFVAPKIIGGASAPSVFGGNGAGTVKLAHACRFQRVRRSGIDIVIETAFG